MDTRTVGVAPKSYFAAVDDYAAFRGRRDGRLVPRASAVRPEAATSAEPGSGLASQIRRMALDYQQAQHFRECAEEYRDQWFAGRAGEIAQVTAMARAGDKRFKGLSNSELHTIGRVRWSQSSRARSLVGKEKRNMQWAQTHLAFAEFELRLLSTGTASRTFAEAWCDEHGPTS